MSTKHVYERNLQNEKCCEVKPIYTCFKSYPTTKGPRTNQCVFQICCL